MVAVVDFMVEAAVFALAERFMVAVDFVEVADSAAVEGRADSAEGARSAAVEDLAADREADSHNAGDLRSEDLEEEAADLAVGHRGADSHSEGLAAQAGDLAAAARAWDAALETRGALRTCRGRPQMAVGIRSEIAGAWRAGCGRADLGIARWPTGGGIPLEEAVSRDGELGISLCLTPAEIGL